MKYTHKRNQHGSLTIEKRSNGKVWVYRWRELAADGKVTHRKVVIGTRQQYPTKSAGMDAVQGLQLDINVGVVNSIPITVVQLISHYKETELADNNKKTQRCKDVYRYQLDKVIAPAWGMHLLRDVKPIAVEKWLNGLPGAPSTKAKTKCAFSVLFQHAMRYEWSVSNPIRAVRQGAMPQREPVVLSPVEVAALLSELRGAFYTIIAVAAITGLRRGELFGLKWEDIDFAKGEIRIQRSLVDQVEGPPKTLASRRPVPMCSVLASALADWRKETEYARPTDWVFASPNSEGRRAYWPDAVLKRHIFPAAGRAGITKRIGWHTFRRTVATLLHSSGASLKTTQDLLRHASSEMTFGVYAQAITQEKRDAQARIAISLNAVAMTKWDDQNLVFLFVPTKPLMFLVPLHK